MSESEFDHTERRALAAFNTAALLVRAQETYGAANQIEAPNATILSALFGQTCLLYAAAWEGFDHKGKRYNSSLRDVRDHDKQIHKLLCTFRNKAGAHRDGKLHKTKFMLGEVEVQMPDGTAQRLGVPMLTSSTVAFPATPLLRQRIQRHLHVCADHWIRAANEQLIGYAREWKRSERKGLSMVTAPEGFDLQPSDDPTRSQLVMKLPHNMLQTPPPIRFAGEGEHFANLISWLRGTADPDEEPPFALIYELHKPGPTQP